MFLLDFYLFAKAVNGIDIVSSGSAPAVGGYTAEEEKKKQSEKEYDNDMGFDCFN